MSKINIKWRLEIKEEDTTDDEWKKVKKFLKENNIKFDEKRMFVFN